MSIVLVGKNSFLAQGVPAQIAGEDLVSISHNEIADYKSVIERARCVINFSFHPALRCAAYQSGHDIDSVLASYVGKDTHYIMISSRTVYGAGSGGFPVFSEGDVCRPLNDYGRNKLLIENKLAHALGKRFTILRLSNVFGFELGRPTFMGRMLDSLKYTGVIKFDIAPHSQRDFLPLSAFQAAVGKILKEPIGGIFNLGSGVGLTPDEMSAWVIEGYGRGKTDYTGCSYDGQFLLNMDRTSDVYGLSSISKDQLKAACIECGAQLRNI